MEYSAAHALAAAIQHSDEYKDYHQYKLEAMADETTAALIKEYRKLQMALQIAAMSGKAPDETDKQRFSGISTLLFTKPEVSQFLLSEMRLQQTMSDVFKIITDAAGIEMALPGE
jgi:Uncharacterized conserved protein